MSLSRYTLASLTTPLAVVGFLGTSGAQLATPAQSLRDQVVGMKLFPYALQPVGGEAEAGAEAELLAALQSLQDSKGANLQPLQAYVSRHPKSPWRISLLTGLGFHYRQAGYLTRALETWGEAWRIARSAGTGPEVEWANHAGTELADLTARLGRTQELADLVVALEGRQLRGSEATRVAYARESLDRMQSTPERNFRCGPLSLASLAEAMGKPQPKLLLEKGSPAGTSLTYNQDLAARYGIALKVVKRTEAELPPLPAILHFRSGHFATVVRSADGRYLVKDPTFGDDAWFTGDALRDEWSGYALVPQGAETKALAQVQRAEASMVMGKGGAPNGDPNQNGACNTQVGGQGCSGKGGCTGMPRHTFHSLLASLFIRDTPVGYAPALGPSAFFEISYSQRDVIQPQVFTYSNLGPKWRFSYQAYVTDDPGTAIDVQSLSMIVKLHGVGGGLKTFVFDRVTGSQPPQHPETGPSLPQSDDHSVLVRSGLTSYVRYFPDGSKEIYGHPDGSLFYPRKVFLTAIVDAAGRQLTIQYDNQHRITSLVDAQGQATTLSYEHADPLKITKVTDPFGRTAKFEYNTDGQLFRVTDVLGLSSEFAYGPTSSAPGNPLDFIHTMKTPYGSYHYTQGGDFDGRWIEAEDPMGGRERAEFKRHPVLKANDADLMPPGFIARYPGGSFYWNQRVMAQYPRDYNRAQHTRWVWGADGEGSVDIPHSIKGAESMDTYQAWFSYPGQGNTNQKGTLSLPDRVIRNTGNGFQTWNYTYNNLGRPTRVTDPLGRSTTLVYAANQMDLLEVRQTSGGRNDLLASYTYNDRHLPLTATDASGQTTSFTYTGEGQLKSITNVLGQSTTMTYNTLGQLERVEGPGGRATSTTYDAIGRVKSVTNPEGETVTMEYDAMDRPVKVSYPDGTFEQLFYDRLDMTARRDRAGRWSSMTYNALRQLVEVKDAMGRVTRLDWCGCGTLDSLVDPLGRITNWVRDLDGRVIAKILPDRTRTAFEYDLLGRLTRRLDAKGQITVYEYNADNSLARISYENSRKRVPTAPTIYTYDPDFSRLVSMQDGTGLTTYGYFPITAPPTLGAGRLATEASPMANSTVAYQYDELGRVVSRSINGVAATVQYDALGRPTQVTNALGAFTFGFEGTTSRLSSLGLPNGMTTAFSYYDATQNHRLKDIHHQTAQGITVSRFGYTYDATGQISTWTQQADVAAPRTYSFTYDAVGQLLEAKLAGADGSILRDFLYGYDPAGNRTSSTIDGESTAMEFNDGNQLLRVTTAASTAPLKVGSGGVSTKKSKPGTGRKPAKAPTAAPSKVQR